MQNNIELFDGIDADLYAISTDSPENSKRLKEAGAFTFSFLSDKSFSVLDRTKMKNDQISYRGISILDQDGTYIHHEINDFWGDQIEQTADIIYEQLNKVN
ncbi:redoxin domain-containing protein [Halalkalibacter krulwichiae]|uniref:AhpC/TSA family protein n=1 Tax=Halalkalibacter krulwichiae TaxID=199441 RepID=A0A1X9MDJ8_9BACI|nr:redoxin domain-containing protein [Halalkalibacter krulwichiae]ARK31508.1 AhpC/TSA family protein [Halalkalibacter krulwichiae]